MKKFFGMVLCLSLIISTVSGIGYAKDNYELEKKYAVKYLQASGYGTVKVVDEIPLFNLEQELEAVCLNLDKSGYVIVNTKDLSIPEFSTVAESPYTMKKGMNFYNGPLNHYQKVNGNIIEMRTGRVVDAGQEAYIYKEKKSDKQKVYNKLDDRSSVNGLIAPQSFLEQGYLTGTLRTWGTGHYCGVDGTAILLMYFDDYYNGNVVPTNLQSATALTDYLVNNKYIYDGGTSGDDVLYGYNGTKGLNQYLKDRGFLYSGYTGVKSSFSWSLLLNKIDSNKPVMIGTNASHPTYPTHWIIAHGYTRGYDGVPYIVVNNGFGSNNINVTASEKYYPWGFVYISEF